ncbi:hypothetical protein ASD65_17065 [Microbacterium sp. Root61]|nr:hypothetical protein ASD65_17065 [Microbacterium sp. Root61]
MISVRNVLVGLGLAFTAYLAARGLLGITTVPYPGIVLGALGLYLVTTWMCILWEPPRRDDRLEDSASGLPRRAKLPVWASALALTAAVIVPTAIAIAVGSEARTSLYATWVIGGIGALMTIVMVRRRPWVAWIGTIVMGAECMFWMGALAALALGLVGSIVWVGVAQLLIRSMDRAARDTTHLATLQRAASAWQASQSVRRRERRVQVQRALAVAGPVLIATVASGGSLSAGERVEARIAEGRLRDELRGPRLLDDDVRAELDAARRRGATVTVLDEGGLDGLDEASLAIIRTQLAETLRSANSDRLYIRTSPHDRVAVTVVGRSASAEGLSDEDAVDLWREIIHPGAADGEYSTL